MTLLETERVVRKISDLLQGGNAAIAPKLAEDYAAVCHAANLRLQQCEAMIKAGDRHQAIQLAETAPNLLDLVTVLEFGGSDAWRSHCQQNALPVAEKIDDRSVHALNECYAKGISTDHPLYAVYRSAMLVRNDGEALIALQSITRLNPADSNAANELVRLDSKVLATRMQHLGDLLEGAEPSLVAVEVERIENFGFKTPLDGDIWRRAQTIRCQRVLEEGARLKDASRWMDALTKLDFVERLRQELKLALPVASAQQLAALQTWAQSEEMKAGKEREFQSLLAELHHRIHQSEEKDTSARFVKLPELKDDFEAMHKVWRSLADFSRSIPDDAAAVFRKRSSLLEDEITRRTAIRMRIIISTSAAVFVVGGLIGWLVLGQMKARDLAAELRSAVAQQQTRAAEKLLERAHAEKKLPSAGGLNEAVAAAETYVAKQHALQSNFDAAFTKLPQQLEGGPEATRIEIIAEQLSLTRKSLDALAPDLKAENQPRLDAFERRWQNFLSESASAVNTQLTQWVSDAEKRSEELDYRSPPEKAASQIAALSEMVLKIDGCEKGFTNHLNLRSDLILRGAAVRAKYDAYDRELKKLTDGITAMRMSDNFAEFSSGLRTVASSEYSTAPAAIAALSVQRLGCSEESTLRTLLGATNPAVWSRIKRASAARFVPELAMPAEQQILRQLSHDPAINANHQRCRLWLDSEGGATVEWITVGVLESTPGWKKIKAWSPSPTAASATFDDHEYGYFDGQYKLSPKQPIFRVLPLGRLSETAAFYSVGLDKAWPGGGAYSGPLLNVLDAIKDSREGSPVFRAYLFQHLIEVMELQPEAWGLAFCPAARAHELQIERIYGGQIESGDWFVAAKATAHQAALEQLFSSAKLMSYARQADGLLALACEARACGLQYVGFAGMDGKASLVEGMNSDELWGYDKEQKPGLLFVKGGQALKLAMPLSPLYALSNSRRKIMQAAGVVAGQASFQGVLPPLFNQSPPANE